MRRSEEKKEQEEKNDEEDTKTPRRREKSGGWRNRNEKERMLERSSKHSSCLEAPTEFSYDQIFSSALHFQYLSLILGERADRETIVMTMKK